MSLDRTRIERMLRSADKHGFLIENNDMDLMHKELTDGIIKTYFAVYNELGFGFLEKVYQNAMYLELKSRGYYVEAQKQIKVHFKGVEVGEYYADLVVNEIVILELKAADCIIEEFESQLLNYLRGTDKEVGLLLNFGKKPEFRRKVFENSRKNLKGWQADGTSVL